MCIRDRCKVVNGLFTFCVNQGDVLVVPSSCSDIIGDEPFAVWTPFKPNIPVAIRVHIFAIHHGSYFLALHIKHLECTPVLKESNAFPIRTVLRLEDVYKRQIVNELFVAL